MGQGRLKPNKHRLVSWADNENYRDLADVNVQDQTTDPIIIPFNQIHNQTTLNGVIAINDRTIIVTSATGIVVGSFIVLFDPVSVRFSTFYVTGVAGTTITLDTLIDFPYPDGTFVDVAITDMSVDGSGTPEVFGLRGTGIPEGVELSMDVTRIIFYCLVDTAVDLSKFGNLTSLTRGLALRTRNDRYKNIFNVKTNGEIDQLTLDWKPYASTNPQQGQDGFTARLTFASQGKLGVAVRLHIGTDLEFLVQDNLTGITFLSVLAEGHIVD